MLELKNVKKYYNSNLALEVPFLQLESSIYWIKGANGSGKTTLLKMIAGLLPFEGDISLENTSLKSKPLAYRQRVSWAEAEPLFPSFITGNDLVNLYKTIRKVSQKEADVLLELFSMNEYISHPVGTYSAGMVKKLSLALAFIGNPQLIVLDEPFITLDTNAYNLACNFIFEKNKADGTAFLMTSHQDPDTELSLSGKVLAVGNRTVVAG